MRTSHSASLLVAALVMLRHPCTRNKATARLLLERAAEHTELSPAEREACLNIADDLDIDLSKAASSPNQTKPDNIQFAIDADARLFWNDEAIDRPEMVRRLALAGKVNPQPELHLRAEKTSQYQAVADIMSEAAKAGLVKIGFATDPAQQQR